MYGITDTAYFQIQVKLTLLSPAYHFFADTVSKYINSKVDDNMKSKLCLFLNGNSIFYNGWKVHTFIKLVFWVLDETRP